MKKYYYTDGKNSLGPFSFDELREKRINGDTKVWFQGLGDWKPAAQIPELADIISISPPPINNYSNTSQPNSGSNNTSTQNTTSYNTGSYNTSKGTPPKTWLLESILATLFCCLPFGIAGIVNASKVESRFYAGDIEGANRSSSEAKKWTTISFWIGLSIGIIYMLVIIANV
jgi:hypothetical protein